MKERANEWALSCDSGFRYRTRGKFGIEVEISDQKEAMPHDHYQYPTQSQPANSNLHGKHLKLANLGLGAARF